jgi:uncharacterized protein YjbI with pentapeptide repeats
MPDQEHLDILKQGVKVWNAWRAKEPSVRPDLSWARLSQADLMQADLLQADLSWARLSGANLGNADLSWANLGNANLHGANLGEANLTRANLTEANLGRANFERAELVRADLSRAHLRQADLTRANLSRANLTEANLDSALVRQANLTQANLTRAGLVDANLSWANLTEANLNNALLSRTNLTVANLTRATLTEAILDNALLSRANLTDANLFEANLAQANLTQANLSRANLSRADLYGAQLVETDLVDATLTNCRIYGISAWNAKLSAGTIQQSLIITPENEPAVTIDDLEVAQFVYLLLHNEKIRHVIDTVGRKGVLLLGRFTEGRIEVLERLRDELRKRGYVPIVFNFDKPETKDFTETVRLLAGLSKFVIADITKPKSSPLELQATIPEIMVPFQPIIEQGETPFAMLQDLWIRYRSWVFEPIEYSSVDRLIETMDTEIIRPAEARSDELVMRRAETLKVRRV